MRGITATPTCSASRSTEPPNSNRRLRVLPSCPSAEIAEALLVPYNATSELCGAVAYFTSETFTSQHPKKRRLPAPARARLIGFARSFHPDQAKLLERRVLQGPGGR